MEVHFSPDKEAHLRQFAARIGKDAAQVIEDAVDWMLKYDAPLYRCCSGGPRFSSRGDLLEHDEVVTHRAVVTRADDKIVRATG